LKVAKTTLNNIVCPFCGCLCDDIVLEIDGNRIVSNRNGCAISKTKFLEHMSQRLLVPCIWSGDEHTLVGLEEAVEKAVDILNSSKRPLIYGLSSTENDAHREAYHIAEVVGGAVDNTSSVCHGPTAIGSQESGEPHGSLAEIRNRADLIIYWGSNPQFAHPRHIARFVKPKPIYTESRTVWVVDIRKSVSAGVADRFVKIEPGSDLEVISAMRALLRGRSLDVTEVGGLPLNEVESLVDDMTRAEYGAFFFGLGLVQSRGKHRNVDAAIRLIQDLNSHTRWTMLPMRGHYNVTGANKTSTWQTGYPFGVDYSRGYPRFQPGEYTAVDLVRRGEVDAILNVAADPVAHFPGTLLRKLTKIPIINLDPKKNMTSLIASVNIPTALSGIEADGAAARMDGLPLYLKKCVEPPEGVLPDRVVLRMILDRLRRSRE
jgi:formylmethanofuran dehydrogenase subunit B